MAHSTANVVTTNKDLEPSIPNISRNQAEQTCTVNTPISGLMYITQNSNENHQRFSRVNHLFSSGDRLIPYICSPH
uniref:Uncharacterized protein n=1 Tax=Rhizophora mucronata TaxID=61149 RepID=A0A2P2JVD4_RHIMU